MKPLKGRPWIGTHGRNGRPKQTWRRSVHNEALEGKSWGVVKKLARNRIRWRHFVDALCP
jgi:hypothetical protein